MRFRIQRGAHAGRISFFFIADRVEQLRQPLDDLGFFFVEISRLGAVVSEMIELTARAADDGGVEIPRLRKSARTPVIGDEFPRPLTDRKHAAVGNMHGVAATPARPALRPAGREGC